MVQRQRDFLGGSTALSDKDYVFDFLPLEQQTALKRQSVMDNREIFLPYQMFVMVL